MTRPPSRATASPIHLATKRSGTTPGGEPAASGRPEARDAPVEPGDERILSEAAAQPFGLAPRDADDEKARLFGPVAGVRAAAALEEKKAPSLQQGFERVRPGPVLRGTQPARARIARRH